VTTFQFSSFSQRFLLVISLGFLAHIITNGLSGSFVQFLPSTFLTEPWRILSYPLGVTSGFEMFSFGFTFYFLATYLERLFDTKKLLTLFSTLLIGQIGIHFLFFHSANVPLLGVNSFTCFTLAVISFSFPRIPVPIFGLFSLRILHLSGILICISFIPELLAMSVNPNSSGLFQILTHQGIAILSGIFVGFYNSYKQLSVTMTQNKTFIQEQPFKPTKQQIFQESNQEESVFVSRYQLANATERSTQSEDLALESIDEEGRLNQILDKISIEGKDSLSSSEVKFLEDYSKKL